MDPKKLRKMADRAVRKFRSGEQLSVDSICNAAEGVMVSHRNESKNELSPTLQFQEAQRRFAESRLSAEQDHQIQELMRTQLQEDSGSRDEPFQQEDGMPEVKIVDLGNACWTVATG